MSRMMMRRLHAWMLAARLLVTLAWSWALLVDARQRAWDREWWRAIREGWVWIDDVGWIRDPGPEESDDA